MPSNRPRIAIRVPPEMLIKFSYVAECNGRSSNKEIEYLIKKHISNFEEEHGVIDAQHTDEIPIVQKS